MTLQPLATACFVTGKAFAEGDAVASYLVRNANLEIVRHDLLASETAAFAPTGFVACSWVHPYKPRAAGENSERTLKLNAETLFLALADPATEPNAENTRLVQFLAFMLERKRLLRPRGSSADGEKDIYEHAKTKVLYQVQKGELTPEFFVRVQAQLSVLVGEPKPRTAVAIASAPEAQTVVAT
ncbi:MAG: hypothetical protein H7343_12640 [Undibacterium sp.]|nr:hypothetical protein [Opitutaceae bacterium]